MLQGVQPQETEVVAKAKRRKFTAAYKREIVRRVDACKQPGEIGALLRGEGLYSSHLTTWRREVAEWELAALAPKKRDPKGTLVDPREQEVASLRRQLAAANERAERAELLVEIQKNHPSAGAHLLNQKLPGRYIGGGPGGAAGYFLETTPIP